jgi:hypothetical protein
MRSAPLAIAMNVAMANQARQDGPKRMEDRSHHVALVINRPSELSDVNANRHDVGLSALNQTLMRPSTFKGNDILSIHMTRRLLRYAIREGFMTTSPFVAVPTQDSTPSNVVPFPLRKRNIRGSDAYFSRSWGVNAVDLEPQDQRLARRIERVLWALLYHAELGPDELRGSKSQSIEKRVSRLVSPGRLQAIARAAITLGMTADLARLAAAVVVFELQAQSRLRNKIMRLFSSERRQAREDTLAIAQMLASDLEALKIRPIDRLAKSLVDVS